jgi:hypothetical protein
MTRVTEVDYVLEDQTLDKKKNTANGPWEDPKTSAELELPLPPQRHVDPSEPWKL